MEIDGSFYCPHCMRVLSGEGPCLSCGYTDGSPQPAYALEEGTLFQNRYLIGAMIGAGGFGITYAAWDYTLAIPVAVKEYYPGDLVSRNTGEEDRVVPPSDEKGMTAYQVGLRRFIRESHLLAMFSGVGGIVAVLDCFEANGTAYIVMEYLRGETLGDYCTRVKPAPGQLMKLIRPTVDTLVTIHRQGVMHRDISPDNLMVLENGEVKLIDFGAAAESERRAAGQDATVVLKRRYAAPEQYLADGGQGPWTDVYGLCATLYALMSGQPAPESPLRKGNEALPALRSLRLSFAQKKALAAGMAVDAERRIRSMDELRARLYHLPMPEEVKQRKRFMRRTIIAASAVLLFIVLLLVNALYGLPVGGGLLCSLTPEGWKVNRYFGREADLSVPASVYGVPLIEVEAYAFEGSPFLESVSLPAYLKRIGRGAFQNCQALHAVDLSLGTPDIETLAFANCAHLLEVTLGNAGTIGDDAFLNCMPELMLYGNRGSQAEDYAKQTGLRYADPSEFTAYSKSDGLYLLAYTGSDLSVALPHTLQGQPLVAVDGGCGWTDGVCEIYLNEYISTLPYAWNGQTRTPLTGIGWGNSLREIGEYALSGLDMEMVTLPSTVTTLGPFALVNCTARRITLPAKITSAACGALSNCEYLEELELPGSLACLSASLLENDYALKRVLLHEGCKSIDKYTFRNCKSLTYAYCPPSLTEIGAGAFSGCEQLMAVYLPGSVTFIDRTAFWGCAQELILFGEKGSYAQRYAEENGYLFEAREDWIDADQLIWTTVDGGVSVEGLREGYAGKETILPTFIEGLPVTELAGMQRYPHSAIVLPALLERVRGYCFRDNRALASVTMRAAVKWIGNYAFSNTSITGIELPESVQSLLPAVFENCDLFSSFTVPSALSVLPSGCLQGSALTDFTVPGHVRLCERALENCLSLRSAIVEEGVVVLEKTFQGCHSLETVSLPASLRVLTAYTFEDCQALKDVWVFSRDVDYFFDENRYTFGDDTYHYLFGADGYVPGTNDDIFCDCPLVRLHGYAGSTTEAYAQRYGLRFVPIEEGEQVSSHLTD